MPAWRPGCTHDAPVPFTWDSAKRLSNLAKHGVAFENVDQLDWQAVRVFPDLRRAYGETRWIGFGSIGGRLHVLVFVPRGQDLRLVSLRKANNKEVKEHG